jgi:hypothetical protein
MYLSEQEKAALKATDIRQVEELIDQVMWDFCTNSLRDLRLASCGPFVAERLRRLERDLAEYAKAKAAKKRAEAQTTARRAGSDLLYAIRDMQHRMVEEEKETELFRVDDAISPPYRFRDRIEVRVSYQWRETVDGEWTYGSITFIQDVDMRPDYTLPAPKRKPSATKQEDARQETLYKHWEHLVTLALHAVRGYLKSHGNGFAIPNTFQPKTDGRSRWLDNLSCNFWQTKPDHVAGEVRS